MSSYIEEKLKEFNNWYDDLDDGLYQADRSEIRDFIKQALEEQEERIREEEYQRRKKEKCETAEVNYVEGYNKARIETKEKIKELKVDEMAASEGINVLKERTSDNLNYRLKTGHKIEWAMAELYNKALEDILKELNI